MNIRFVVVTLVCATLVFFCSLEAKSSGFPEYRFHTMPETSYYGGIHSIAKDSVGRMWFSGFDALFMYDGTDFIRMDGKVTGLCPSAYWEYGKVAVDGRGELFVATNRALLRYVYGSDGFLEVLSGKVTSMDVDTSGVVWMIHNGVVESIDGESVTSWHFSPDMYISSRIMTVICSGENVYVASDGYLYLLDRNSARYSLVTVIGAPGSTVLDVMDHGDHRYILTQMHGVYRCDMDGNVRKRFSLPDRYKEFSGMKELYLDENGLIWVATQSGIMFIDTETDETSLVRSDLHYPYSLPNNSVWSIYKDPDVGVWIGTYGGKLAYTSPYDDGVDRFGAMPGGLNHPIVSCFEEDKDGNLWIGTEGGGLNFWDRKNGRFTYYTADNGSGLVSNMIKRLRYDSDGALVVSSFNGGLKKYDARKDRFVDMGGFLPKVAYDFAWNGKSGVWMTNPDGELAYADMASGHSDAVKLRDRHGNYVRTKAESVFLGGDGNVWLVTHSGCYVTDPSGNDILKHYYIEDAHYNVNNLCSWCVDSYGCIWFGSRGGGVNVLTSDGVYSNFKDRSGTGLDGRAVFGIIEDPASGNIWFSTDDGLYFYDRIADRMDKSRIGSPSLCGAFYVRSCFRTSAGELLFGGTDGFIMFSPDKMQLNGQRPEVFFTGMKVNGDDVNFRTGKVIGLSHRQSNLEISFSTDSYLYSQKNQYSYRVVGLYDEWTLLPAGQKTVQLLNTPPGKYRFEIIASNNDGLWGDRVSFLKFRIFPSPFLTWWACLIYVLVAAGVFFIIVFIKRKLENTEIELKKLYDKKYIAGPSNIVVSSADDGILKKAMELIEKNMDNSDYGVDDFVEDMAMGRTVLYQKISELTGMSIKEFILDLRLKRASQLLRETELTVSEISYMTGFTNPKYFSTCFRKHFRQSPSEYRSSSLNDNDLSL